MIKELQDLASKMVGDGKLPNAYFATDVDGVVMAIMLDEAEAIEFAKAGGVYLLEDRLNGVVWTSRAFDRLHAAEDETDERNETPQA